MASKRKRGQKPATPAPTPFPWTELELHAVRHALVDMQQAREKKDKRWTIPRDRVGAAAKVIKAEKLQMQSASRTTAMSPDKLVLLLKEFKQELGLGEGMYRLGLDAWSADQQERLFRPGDKQQGPSALPETEDTADSPSKDDRRQRHRGTTKPRSKVCSEGVYPAP